MYGLLVAGAAKGLLSTFIKSYAKETAVYVAKDTLEGSKRTIDEWAEIVIKFVDKIKDDAINEGNLRYVGGKINFAMSAQKTNMVAVSFELYFLDEHEKWQKIGADNEINASNFTLEAVREIIETKKIVFEVE